MDVKFYGVIETVSVLYLFEMGFLNIRDGRIIGGYCRFES